MAASSMVAPDAGEAEAKCWPTGCRNIEIGMRLAAERSLIFFDKLGELEIREVSGRISSSCFPLPLYHILSIIFSGHPIYQPVYNRPSFIQNIFSWSHTLGT